MSYYVNPSCIYNFERNGISREHVYVVNRTIGDLCHICSPAMADMYSTLSECYQLFPASAADWCNKGRAKYYHVCLKMHANISVISCKRRVLNPCSMCKLCDV